LTYRILYSILQGIYYFLNIFSWLIIINSLLSWFMDPYHPIRSLIRQFVDPVVNPFRRITDRFISSGIPIDLAPLFAFFAINLVKTVVRGLLDQLVYLIC
jgi:YggT family protein